MFVYQFSPTASVLFSEIGVFGEFDEPGCEIVGVVHAVEQADVFVRKQERIDIGEYAWGARAKRSTAALANPSHRDDMA